MSFKSATPNSRRTSSAISEKLREGTCETDLSENEPPKYFALHSPSPEERSAPSNRQEERNRCASSSFDPATRGTVNEPIEFGSMRSGKAKNKRKKKLALSYQLDVQTSHLQDVFKCFWRVDSMQFVKRCVLFSLGHVAHSKLEKSASLHPTQTSLVCLTSSSLYRVYMGKALLQNLTPLVKDRRRSASEPT